MTLDGRIVDKFGQLDEFLAILKGVRKTPLNEFLKNKILIGVDEILHEGSPLAMEISLWDARTAGRIVTLLK